MGKLNYLLVSLLIGIVLVSCQKDDLTPVTSKGATASGQNSGGTSASSSDNNSNNSISSTSNSSNGSSVTPQIIAGANNGGNRTCEEVGLAFMNDASYFDLCGEKIDYSDGGFKGEFPEGLNVSTDGKYVSFEAGQCIRIGDKFYRVGAVIVKGSNAANVYFYPDGTLGDSGLSAPVNASGKPAGLSNLSFCFVECKLVIAFKSYLTQDWACTSGGPGNISFVGYYDFIPDHEGYKIYFTAHTDPATADLTKPVGNLMISDVDDDGLLEVTVDNADRTDLLFTDAYLFVGTLEQYNLSYYTGFPYKTGVITPVPSITFELPF